MAYGKIKADTLVYDNSGSDVEVTLSSLGNKANLASPTFTGTVTIPTPTAGDNTTKAASTAFVVAGFAPKDAPAFTGTATGANLTLSGTLTVNGTTTTVASTNTTITDNLIELNSGASSNANDSGILIERGSTGDNAIIAWDESADKFIVGTTTGTASSTGDITIATGTLVATVEGTATGLAGSPNITCGTVTDSKGDVRKIPSNAQSSAHVATAADAGKAIYISTGGVTLNNSVFAAGDAVTIINNSGSDQTITQGSGVTIHNAADAATGNRTLAGRGMATVWFASASVAYISGAGLS
mgnify:CR=1 FL=1|jgi:hypothetical protein